MEYLKRAEHYCLARGDELWFKNLYTDFRQYNSVEDAVWKTLTYLYGTWTADQVEAQRPAG